MLINEIAFNENAFLECIQYGEELVEFIGSEATFVTRHNRGPLFISAILKLNGIRFQLLEDDVSF